MRSVLFLVAACSLPLPAGADEPKVIPAAEASRHVDEVVTVEMPVRSTGSSRKEGFVFLNTHENFRSNENFTVVFATGAQAAFKAAGIDNVEKHYFRKVIRVTGKVRHFKSVTDIQVERPDQIAVVGPVADVPKPAAAGNKEAAPAASPAATQGDPQPEPQSFVNNPLVYGAFGLFGLGLLVFGASRLRSPRQPLPPVPDKGSAA